MKSCCVATPVVERYTVTVKFPWTRTKEHHRGVCAACVQELTEQGGAGIVSARPFIEAWMTADPRAMVVAS